jgi:hypothetical protein
MSVRLHQIMKRFLTCSGTILSGCVLIASVASGIEKWCLNINPNLDLSVTAMILLIALMFPLINSLRYEESDLKPLVNPSRVFKIVSKIISLGLLFFSINRFYLVLCMPKNERGDGILYQFCVAFMIFISWSSLVLYCFGLRSLFPERIIAVSRHPIFLFRKDLLLQYLNHKNGSKK